jgi:hypothetical protein
MRSMLSLKAMRRALLAHSQQEVSVEHVAAHVHSK